MQSIRKKSFAAEQLAKRQKKNPTSIAIIVLAVIIAVGAVGYAVYVRFGEKEVPTENVSPADKKIKSIAVLPLDSFSDDPDQINFSDAMHDAIITNLSRICAGTIRVISRNSASRYKDTEKTLPEIAHELDVDAVIEGSVYPSENRVRIIVQLIAMNPERHLWQNDYTKELRDVLSLQNEVAREIASEIKVTLSDEEETRLASVQTVNPEAYNLYVQGRHYYNEAEFEKAVELLEKAITKDPGFAQAHSLLSRIYQFYDREKAKSAADRALELDPALAEPHMTYAYLYQRIFDWQKAESECKQALALDPSNSGVHTFYATHLRMICHYEEALQKIATAQKIDPLNSWSYGAAVAIYAAMDRFDEAMKQYRRGKEFNPDNWYIDQHYGRMLYKMGDYAQAREVFGKWEGTHEGPERFGYIHALAGEHAEAEKVLNDLIDSTKNGSIPSTYIIFIYAALGEKEKALDWLERMYEEGSHNMLFIKTDFEFDPLRSEPRFQAILKKMNLAD